MKNTSIRNTLFVTLGVLNLLIAVVLGYDVLTSWHNLRVTQKLIDNADVSSPLFVTEKYLAQERSWSIAAIYSEEGKGPQYRENLNTARRNVDSNIEKALKELKDGDTEHVTLSLSKMEDDYKKLLEAREKVDAFQPGNTKANKARSSIVASEIVSAATSLVNSIQLLIEDHALPLMADNPAAARQMRFSYVVGEITEYASREYTVLAKLIAENEYPPRELQEQLALWRGRINYGWDIVNGEARTSNWGQAARPILEKAENEYFSTFEEIKGIFKPGKSARPDYPLSVDAWLDVASDAVDSMYDMNEAVMLSGLEYRQDVQKEAIWTIFINVLFFILAMTLSLYLWRLIAMRVLHPLGGMVDSLYKTANGEQTALPVYDRAPEEIVKLSKVLGALQSYSAQVEKERDNARAANSAKTDFLANISHELRTPMNVVLGLSDIISRSEPLTGRQKEYVASLSLSAKSLLTLINDLLDFSQLESGHLQIENISFNFPQLLSEVNSFMCIEAKEKGLDVALSMNCSQDTHYWGDPTRIRQVLINLYANAIKFTAKGSVKLDINCIPLRKGYDVVTLRVSDTGIGIPPDQLERIFDRFTQVDASINRKYGGTGLGLAITKVLVEMMGGTIVVESIVGVGSSFTVTLEFRQVSLEGSETQKKDGEIDGMTEDRKLIDKKVLLVEDYAPNILVGSQYLEDLGYSYDIAETGEAAFEMVQNNRYSAVLLDVQLPDMLGYDVTKAIRAYEESQGLEPTRIIGVTAYALEKDREKCMAVGMDDYLAKPYTVDELSSKIMRRYN